MSGRNGACLRCWYQPSGHEILVENINLRDLRALREMFQCHVYCRSTRQIRSAVSCFFPVSPEQTLTSIKIQSYRICSESLPSELSRPSLLSFIPQEVIMNDFFHCSEHNCVNTTLILSKSQRPRFWPRSPQLFPVYNVKEIK